MGAPGFQTLIYKYTHSPHLRAISEWSLRNMRKRIKAKSEKIIKNSIIFYRQIMTPFCILSINTGDKRCALGNIARLTLKPALEG